MGLVTSQAHSGSNAMQVAITSLSNGDRKAMMPFNSSVRAIHAVLMYHGDVLLVAGSGNDQFAAGPFTSAVYDPRTGSHGYEGLNTSYIINPATNTYQKVNNLTDGH